MQEKQRQLQYWKRRLDLFMHMRYEFERLGKCFLGSILARQTHCFLISSTCPSVVQQTELPDPPELIVLQVVGETSLGLKIVHSLRGHSNRTQQEPPAAGELLYPLELGQSQQRQQRLACLDPKCSHWLISGSAGADQLPGQADLGKQQLLSAASKQQELQGGLTGSQMEQQDSKQQKLAVFNQLLAQQLILLSHQQRLGQQARLGLAGTYAPGAANAPLSGEQQAAPQQQQQHRQQQQLRPQNRPLIKLTQNNSTDSACDSINAAQRQPYLAGAAISGESGVAKVGADQVDLEHCPSIAYQLMTATSQHGRAFERAQRQLAGQTVRDPSRSDRSLAPEDRIIITKYKGRTRSFD